MEKPNVFGVQVLKNDDPGTVEKLVEDIIAMACHHTPDGEPLCTHCLAASAEKLGFYKTLGVLVERYGIPDGEMVEIITDSFNESFSIISRSAE